MKILNRYIFLECAGFFLLSLFAFTGILFTIQLLKFSDLIINRGVAMHQIAMVFAALIPTFLEFALPMSTLLGIMLGFARLSGDSEVVVLRSSGVSIYQLLSPIALFAIVLGISGFIVSTQLKPWGFKTLAATLFEVAKSRSTAGLDEGVFNRLGDLTLYSESINYETGELKHVMVDDRRNEEQRKIIFATNGIISSNDETHTVSIQLIDGMMHEKIQGKYALTYFVNNEVSISPDDLYGDKANSEIPPRSLYLNELSSQISHHSEYIRAMNLIPDLHRDSPLMSISKESLPEILQAKGVAELTPKEITKRYRRLKLEQGLRFSMPLASFILAFIAMPLGIQPPRAQKNWGATLSFLLGLGVFLLYYGILSVGMTFADSGKVNPYIVCWLPNIALATAAVFAVKGVASEKVQSISQLFEPLINSISKRLSAAT